MTPPARTDALTDLLRRMVAHATDYRGDLDAAKALRYLAESGYELRVAPMPSPPNNTAQSALRERR